MLRNVLFAAFFCLVAGLVSAQPKAAVLDWRRSGPPAWATPEDISAEKHLRNICMYVVGFSEAEPDPSHNYRYQWQVKFARAAQAEGEIDTPEEEARLQRVWRRFEDKGLLVCNSLQFDVPNGSIVKNAAIISADAFIDFVAQHKLGLSRVDESDGRTLLDYIQDHMERTKGGEIEKKLRIYYQQLRAAGAKHRRELP